MNGYIVKLPTGVDTTSVTVTPAIEVADVDGITKGEGVATFHKTGGSGRAGEPKAAVALDPGTVVILSETPPRVLRVKVE